MLNARVMAKRVLVTAALPYANGSIHLGHMLEYVQTDVYVRARKLAGEDVLFAWADDTHGTPIMVRAMKEGITPEELIAKAYDEHRKVFEDFGIGFDIFHSTNAPENREQVDAIYGALKDKGLIKRKGIEQLYCPVDGMFLPDRFVKGTCPVCKSPDQYGDSCEVCGSTYDPTELIEPFCAVCKGNGLDTKPELRPTDHVFVDLGKQDEVVRAWLKAPSEGGTTVLQDSVRNYVMQWVEGGLKDWDISRDEPYFGFPVPGEDGKYFYVWFSAPVGYVSATQKWCADNGGDFDAYWKTTRDETEIVHVIGKDIVYHHTLFWPAMLAAAGYTTPSRVQVHGWLQVNGEKMSKSRGTFILARTYLDHLPPDYLRYYFAFKLNADQNDFDLSLEDFAGRVNGDLVNKLANLASRCVKLVNGKLGGKAGRIDEDGDVLLKTCADKFATVPDLYRNFESGRALGVALEIAELANAYLNDNAPWKAVKTDPERALAVLTVGLQASIMIAAVLTPVLPDWGPKVARALKLEAVPDFRTGTARLAEGHALGEYEALAERIDKTKLEAIVEASKEDLQPSPSEADAAGEHGYEVEALAPESTIDAFDAVDLRVGRVTACQVVEGSKKLLQLTIDLGPLGVRNVFSGIRLSYKPEELVGKHVVVYANLKPRKMRFGVSEGMVLASGGSDDSVTVLELDPGSLPGDKIT